MSVPSVPLFALDASGVYRPAGDDLVVSCAISVIESRMRSRGEAFSDPSSVKTFLRLHLGNLPYEVFAVLFLDSQNRLIAFEQLFRGTLNQTSVYPREVVVCALKHEACSVVLSHNHPSNCVTPSRADEALTQNLKAALALVDVRVLDHVIVSASGSLSMAEQGLL